MENLFFFDSWGGLWVTCPASDPRAQAFGPGGVSRPADPCEANLEVGPWENPWCAAAMAGRLVLPEDEDDTGWDTLI